MQYLILQQFRKWNRKVCCKLFKINVLNRQFLLACLFIFSCSVNLTFSREMNGIAHSNFAGNMGIEMDPASIATMPYRFEFNILSGDIFRMIIFLSASGVSNRKVCKLLRCVMGLIVTIVMLPRMLVINLLLKGKMLCRQMRKQLSEFIFLYIVS